MRTLNDFVIVVIKDIGQDVNDRVLKETIKGFVLRGYKELAKRERWSEIPTEISDTEEFQTLKDNDEFIIAYAKYFYFQGEEEYQKSEVFKRDYENYNVKIPKQTYAFEVVR